MFGKNALVAASAVALLALAPAAHAAVNLLANPDLEPGTGGANAGAGDVPATVGNTTYPWQGYNPYVAPYGAYYTSSINHTPGGSQSLKTFGGPNSGVFQQVGVTGGDSYTGTVFTINNANDPLMGGAANTIDLRIQFFRVDGSPTGNLAISPTTISGATPTSTTNWTQLSVTATAPADAVYVDFRVFQNNPTFAGGALFADDASFVDNTAVPEPASLAVLGLAGLGLTARRRSPWSA